MLLGLPSSCTIIFLPFGVHLIWIGFVFIVVFWAAQKLAEKVRVNGSHNEASSRRIEGPSFPSMLAAP